MKSRAPEWLLLREPADHRARPPRLRSAICDWAQRRRRVRVLDLGSGVGSNLRYLAPVLGADQDWELVDHDPDVLVHAERYTRGLVPVQTRCTDIASLTEADLEEVDLVTGSALLDELDEPTLDHLIGLCARARCVALFSLTATGEVRLTPPGPADAEICEGFNAHRRATGGPNGHRRLGPDAGRAAAIGFGAAAYSVIRARSDWQLEAADSGLARAWLDAWCDGACEHDRARAPRFRETVAAHREALEAGDCRLEVGHVDLLALPARRPPQR